MRYLAVLLCLFISSPSHASDKISFVSPEWPNYTNRDGTGYFLDLLKEIYEPEGFTIEHHITPFKRALFVVEKKEADVSAGCFKIPERLEKFIYPRSRSNDECIGLVFLKDTPFNGVENITGLVGNIKGHDYSAWLPSHVRICGVSSSAQAIHMLRRKRILYHVDSINDILTALKHLDDKKDDFVIERIYVKPIFFIFRKDERGQRLADSFDEGINRLTESGGLKEIREKYGIREYFDAKGF